MRQFQKIASVLFLFAAISLHAAGKAAHVVVVVWDGMRPDFVTETTTPTLWKMAREGATFANHHPVYISSTEVNGTAIATGCHPEVSGIVANREYRPDINATNAVAIEELQTVRKGDRLTDGHYIQAATVAETLRANGRRTVVVGSKAVALLQDRFERGSDSTSIVVFEGQSIPSAIASNLAELFGKFPDATPTRTNRDIWNTSALIGPLWEKDVPAYSLLWLGEPDGSQHYTAPGSSLALKAIKNSDDMLARVLAVLDKRNLRDKTDVIVVSDHGFSTITDSIDLVGLLKTNGFPAFRHFPSPSPADGDILVVGGPSALIYVTGHDHAVIERITHFLQSQPFCGVIFTKNPVSGAFPLDAAKVNSAAAPDIMLSMRWTAQTNNNHAPGRVGYDSAAKSSGNGTHGTLSRFDMHNICFASGPDFQPGVVDTLASGNVDIAPTVLWILGVEPKQPLSGRVLGEAMIGDAPKVDLFAPAHIEASYKGDGFVWKQYLNYTKVNRTIYLDEGNGEQIP